MPPPVTAVTMKVSPQPVLQEEVAVAMLPPEVTTPRIIFVTVVKERVRTEVTVPRRQ